MPEGPELHIASRFVNIVCRDRIFTGKVIRSAVSKSEEVPFSAEAYTITAASRGKEMQLILSRHDDACTSGKSDAKKAKTSLLESLKILFRFGMSGKFQFTSEDELHKHSHLRFFTADKPPMVLSFVDVRRFGRWEVDADWSPQRGPDPMFEYQSFRKNVVNNLTKSVFDKPICEVLLDQKFFNGIGNYLRAEILYRAGIPPFSKARTALEGLPEIPPDTKVKDKMDLLHLCHIVPLEVINLKGSTGFNPDGRALDYEVFEKWLQCYYQPNMTNLVDSHGRTIWFKGPAGPMVPKGAKTRGVKNSKKRKSDSKADEPAEEVNTKKAKVPKSKKKKVAKSEENTVKEVDMKSNGRLTRRRLAQTVEKAAAATNNTVTTKQRHKATRAKPKSISKTPAKKAVAAKKVRGRRESTSSSTVKVNNTTTPREKKVKQGSNVKRRSTRRK
ncbi:endonuclease 8-like 1 [Ptychodera flava]|uniref:endonuclease 8-like 1 n=1 Tax=Ptychodera flava TaxID=63121 RepID=UPI00396A0997